jgi:hypothetical protein
MIKITKTRTRVPAVSVAPAGALSAGSVYVEEDDPGAARDSGLRDGQRVVLETADGSLELVTRSKINAEVTAAGTYLNETDETALVDRANPTLRLYGLGDWWRKVRSRQGVLLLITTLAGLLAAGAGLYLALAGTSPTPAVTVADRGNTALEWAVAPVERLESHSSGRETTAARREVKRRRAAVARCLTRLGGGEAPASAVPGVKCESSSSPWWKNKDTATWVTLGVGLITAVVAALGLNDRYGFGKSPASA